MPDHEFVGPDFRDPLLGHGPFADRHNGSHSGDIRKDNPTIAVSNPTLRLAIGTVLDCPLARPHRACYLWALAGDANAGPRTHVPQQGPTNTPPDKNHQKETHQVSHILCCASVTT